MRVIADSNGEITIEMDAVQRASLNALVILETPEPTTATQSLLTLAGLCARRRRK